MSPDEISEKYERTGVSDILPVISSEKLQPLQELIFDCTKQFLPEHDAELSLCEKLRLPFSKTPEQEDYSKLMNTVSDSAELKAVISDSEIEESFCKVLATPEVVPFPISRFRSQFPHLQKSTYSWHQDQGTWYAVKVKNLAEKMPTTLWLSINGANEGNSIELIPCSHKGRLEKHNFVEGQGHFNADLPETIESLPRTKVSCQPGEGVFFHALTFHKSIRSESSAPRYSIDIRYHRSEETSDHYKVDWRFRLKRLCMR